MSDIKKRLEKYRDKKFIDISDDEMSYSDGILDGIELMIPMLVETYKCLLAYVDGGGYPNCCKELDTTYWSDECFKRGCKAIESIDERLKDDFSFVCFERRAIFKS